MRLSLSGDSQTPVCSCKLTLLSSEHENNPNMICNTPHRRSRGQERTPHTTHHTLLTVHALLTVNWLEKQTKLCVKLVKNMLWNTEEESSHHHYQKKYRIKKWFPSSTCKQSTLQCDLRAAIITIISVHSEFPCPAMISSIHHVHLLKPSVLSRQQQRHWGCRRIQAATNRWLQDEEAAHCWYCTVMYPLHRQTALIMTRNSIVRKRRDILREMLCFNKSKEKKWCWII